MKLLLLVKRNWMRLLIIAAINAGLFKKNPKRNSLRKIIRYSSVRLVKRLRN